MSENKDPERVKIKAMELGEMIERFKQIHADYHSLLDVEEERGESQRYFDGFLETHNNWKVDWRSRDKSELANSVRQVGSKASSRADHKSERSYAASSQRSRTSSAADARLRVAVKKAALMAEAASLQEQQRFAHDKLHLDQGEIRLQLKMQIAKAEAQERE